MALFYMPMMFFSKTCEYSTIELIGEPYNIIRHPDMPKVIFKAL